MMNFGMLSIVVLFLKIEPVDLVKTALGMTVDMSGKDNARAVRRQMDVSSTRTGR